MEEKLVSVIVRTKDRPTLLQEALESLAAQTHPYLEVIVVNDGGEDVFNLVQAFSDRFEKLKYLAHESPKGRAAAANTGLSAVEGDYFAFLDDDDLLLPEHFAFLLDKTAPNIIPYSRVRYEGYDEEKKLVFSFSPWEGPFSKELLLLGNFIPFHSLLFPKEVLDKIGFIDESLELFEDWDFLLRAAEVFRFKACNQITACYRFFNTQDSLARNLHRSVAEKEAFLKVVAKHRTKYSPELWYEAFIRRVALRYELSLLQEKTLSLEHLIEREKERQEFLTGSLKALERTLKSCEQKLENLSEALAQEKKQRDELERHLRTMEETLGWRMLLKLRRVLERLAPPGTYREKGLILTKFFLQTVFFAETRQRFKEGIRKFLPYARSFGLRAALSRALSKASTPPPLPPAQKTWGYILTQILVGQEPASLPSLEEKVTVVVPVYNAFEKLKQCLSSLIAHTDLSQVHLLVIDDASTDERVFPYLKALSEKFGFELRRHTQNQGFVRTVNEAISARRGHLVILNSDTEVPPGWLERLLEPLLKEPERIASTTPFSNRATICSFPEFCQENDLPEGVSLEELDALFALLRGRIEPVRIPTGVGFCMALNDLALKRVGGFDEKTFGRGYGEENDWCLRAEKAGFIHVLVPWLFVAHHHGASFGPEKKRLAEEGVRRVEAKHPGYLRRIHEFIAKDPAREIRHTIKALLGLRTAPSPRILAVSHAIGGGSELFLNDFQTLLHKNSFALLYFNADQFLFKYLDDVFTLPADPRALKKLVELIEFDVLFINHLVEAPQFETLITTLKELTVKKVYFLHDYLPLCPVYNLIGEKGLFCGLPKDENICQRCLRIDLTRRGITAKVPPVHHLGDWRRLWRSFLKTTTVVAPSKTAASLFSQVFPEIEVKVIPHLVEPLKGYQPPKGPRFPLTVAIFGGLSVHKGAEVVYRLADKIRTKRLPLRLVLFGYTYREKSRQSRELIITGPYRREELPTLCQRYQPRLALIPSLWPETFSYTLSEALSLGLPCIVFDVGAPAERIRRSGAGVVVPLGDEKALLKTLLYLAERPEELAALQSKTDFNEITPGEWKRRWQEVLFTGAH